ncbi:MAG TPA: MBL fold metallo-hydrolase [Gemmatimonadaceae bacterium]|nr:MBL fold metallo-hydrolase [Gemmatimonadaceae bacterium]
MASRLFLCALLAAPAVALGAQTPNTAGPPPFTFIEVVPGIYAAIEPRQNALSPFVHGNSMFVVNDSDVFAFDANHTPSAARATIAQLRAITTKPVRQLMLSHFHGDHTMGVEAFVEAFPGIEVIATDSTRDDIIRTLVRATNRTAERYAKTNAQYDSMANAGVDLAGRPLTPERRQLWEATRYAFRNYYSVEAPTMKIVAPTTTFDTKMKIWSGAREIDLLSFGRGDTRGDGIVWLPTERVVATGDVLVDPAPYSGANHPSDWLATLRAIRALDPLHIVPGHGDVQHDTKYLDLVIAVTDSTIRAVRQAAASNLTEEQTVKRVTMPQFRQRFTHGEPLIEDRWNDFIEGLVRGAYGEAKHATTRRVR